MTYEVFTVDTITGKRRVAVKTRADAFPGDARSDAWTIAQDAWGRGSRLSPVSSTLKRLPKEFREAGCARGWGAVA